MAKPTTDRYLGFNGPCIAERRAEKARTEERRALLLSGAKTLAEAESLVVPETKKRESAERRVSDKLKSIRRKNGLDDKGEVRL